MGLHIILASFALLLNHVSAWTIEYQPQYFNGTVPVEKISTPGNLDGIKLQTSANKSTSDWWYFDSQVTTPGDDSTVEITFFNSGDFQQPHPLSVQVTGVFPNGTRFHKTAMADDGATFTVDEDGVRGQWKGAGANFSGTAIDKPDLTYTINMDSPQIGVSGTFVLKSRGTPHYPCGPMEDGVTEQLLPTFMWANAVPDAEAIVDLVIDGVPVKFTGTGYHDKNWADDSIIAGPKFWNWGHANFGPYAVVWFSPLDQDLVEHPHSYVLRDGEVLQTACGEGSVEVRQWGENATWPPTVGLKEVDGVVARFNLPSGEILVANLTKTIIVLDEVVHARGNAIVTGGIEGGCESYEGHAHFEEFAYGI